MNRIFNLIGLISLALLMYQCGDSTTSNSGTTTSIETANELTNQAASANKIAIQTNIEGAAGIQAYLYKVMLVNGATMLDKQDVGQDGSVNFLVGKEEGVYRIRIGTKDLYFILSGKEKAVTINGDLSTIGNYAYEVKGSSESDTYLKGLQYFIANQPTEQDIANFVDSTSAPLAGMFMTWQVLNIDIQGKNIQNFKDPRGTLEIHQKANDKVKKGYPNSEYAQEYYAYISQVGLLVGRESIKIGSTPPNIMLSSPDGTIYSLEDLKGQVVLLDFWASWCGPCRRENPNVVRIYDKYKDKGFTVYSVSLDRKKDAWEKAIQKDALVWRYHVSDLQFWQSAPALAYGVSSIPKTFLLDKDGKIAAMDLRGASLEQAVVKLL